MLGQIFSWGNYIILTACVLLLVVGYVLLGQGPVYNYLSWSVAPVILVLVYCVFIPVAIMYRKKEISSDKKNK